MKIKSIHSLSLFVSIIICLAGTSVLAQQLIVPGCGSSKVILQELAAAFNAENPGSEVVIPHSIGSRAGIRLVGTGEYELGRVSEVPDNSEMDYGLKYLKFAKDMLVFVVGPKVGIDNLSSRQLADVYSGKIKNWQEVGGNNLPVRLLVKDPEDYTVALIRQQLDSFKDIKFPGEAKVLFHEHEMVEAFNKYSTVIGWLSHSTLKTVNPSVNPIAIDNVTPAQQDLYDGNYDLVMNHALVYREGRLSGLAKKFVEFIFSKEGSIILVRAGLVPFNEHSYR